MSEQVIKIIRIPKILNISKPYPTASFTENWLQKEHTI